MPSINVLLLRRVNAFHALIIINLTTIIHLHKANHWCSYIILKKNACFWCSNIAYKGIVLAVGAQLIYIIPLHKVNCWCSYVINDTWQQSSRTISVSEEFTGSRDLRQWVKIPNGLRAAQTLTPYEKQLVWMLNLHRLHYTMYMILVWTFVIDLLALLNWVKREKWRSISRSVTQFPCCKIQNINDQNNGVTRPKLNLNLLLIYW